MQNLLCKKVFYVARNERYGLYGSARRRRRNSGIDGWPSSSGGANAVDRYYKYSTRVNLREPPVDPNEPEVKYVVRERYVEQRLCSRVFCPSGSVGQAVNDGGRDMGVSPARWLSCGVLDTATDADLGYHDDEGVAGHLLWVGLGGQDGGTSSDPELYSCASMSVIHTTQPMQTSQKTCENQKVKR